MANIRALATIAILVTAGSGASIAMPPQDIPGEVKSCQAITDDKARLRCFDSLFGRPSKLQNPPEGSQANWSIDETKSTDGGPQVVAANLVGDTVLVLRCKDQTTEAAFSTQYNYLGYKSVDVQLRVNDQNPFKEVWEGVNKWSRCICSIRCGFNSVLAGQCKAVNQDHAIRWESERGSFQSGCCV